MNAFTRQRIFAPFRILTMDETAERQARVRLGKHYSCDSGGELTGKVPRHFLVPHLEEANEHWQLAHETRHVKSQAQATYFELQKILENNPDLTKVAGQTTQYCNRLAQLWRHLVDISAKTKQDLQTVIREAHLNDIEGQVLAKLIDIIHGHLLLLSGPEYPAACADILIPPFEVGTDVTTLIDAGDETKANQLAKDCGQGENQGKLYGGHCELGLKVLAAQVAYVATPMTIGGLLSVIWGTSETVKCLAMGNLKADGANALFQTSAITESRSVQLLAQQSHIMNMQKARTALTQKIEEWIHACKDEEIMRRFFEYYCFPTVPLTTPPAP